MLGYAATSKLTWKKLRQIYDDPEASRAMRTDPGLNVFVKERGSYAG